MVCLIRIELLLLVGFFVSVSVCDRIRTLDAGFSLTSLKPKAF